MSLTWKRTEDSTPEVQKFCDMVRKDLEGKIKISACSALTFRAVNTEILYIAKVLVGENNYAHVKISQTLPCYGGQVNLVDFQFPKKDSDLIEPF